jgi:hypothetical protein
VWNEASFPGECVLNFGREYAQRVPVRRQSDAARRTGNQRLADDFLKSPKMSGDRWLRQMQLLRRRRNFPALRNGQERSEKSQVEVVRVHSSLFRKASCLNALMSQYRYRYDSSSQLTADWKYPQIA